MKKILLLLVLLPLCMQAKFSMHDSLKWVKMFQGMEGTLNSITKTLPKKIALAKNIVKNYNAKKFEYLGKKLSQNQYLAITLSAISEALAAFTYPALGQYDDSTKTPGLTWSTLLTLGYNKAKGAKKKAYLGMVKATRELSGAIESLDLISFLLYPGKSTGDTSTPPELPQEDLDALDDLDLDDI